MIRLCIANGPQRWVLQHLGRTSLARDEQGVAQRRLQAAIRWSLKHHMIYGNGVNRRATCSRPLLSRDSLPGWSPQRHPNNRCQHSMGYEGCPFPSVACEGESRDHIPAVSTGLLTAMTPVMFCSPTVWQQLTID